ncbi:helix-turn-helix domain-containing protein [Flavobacterium sp. '19STA2R22 D10 B1']|uniref:helix-turn-helix domain-containing protein n=1 Tax=Flavobacterium aerium TaxID=3037261 RepID=UPI00278C8ADB|nr:helix-turn-helix transcriptional regulator [Flavobacterium sp. '19STA2R22 D10 B1']
MDIGNAIKDLRQQKGFKQTDFAVKCGLSQSYLSSIEKGNKEPTLGILKQIANALSIPMPVLVFFSLDKNDISESKRDAFEMLVPSIKGLISDVFIS